MSPSGGRGARRLRGRVVGSGEVDIECSCGTRYTTDLESIGNGWARCKNRSCGVRPNLDELDLT